MYARGVGVGGPSQHQLWRYHSKEAGKQWGNKPGQDRKGVKGLYASELEDGKR